MRALSALVAMAAAGSLFGATIQVNDESITGTHTWTADNTYVLNGLVFVESGEVLHIEPGTVIKGKPGEGAAASALVVARGGQIFAEGTATRPIIFTAEADDVSDPEDFGPADRGLWGGVIILGRSTLNSPVATGTEVNGQVFGITDNVEGIDINEPRGVFGGTNEADNSGVLRYVSIRHGGTLIGADNEINGLTLGAVGSGTTIEFVEVFANLDDGIEFFGGTVNTKFLAVAYCGDDSFDYDQGFRGKGQFWFTIQDSDSGDGGEHDGDIDDDTKTPLSRPQVYNATFIGAGADSGTSRRAFNIRDNAGALYNNSIFTDFGGRAIDVQDDSADRVGAGDLDFRNNLWWNFGAGSTPQAIANANALPLFTEGNRDNAIADPQLRGISRTFDQVLDPRPAEGSVALTGAGVPPVDGFFSNVRYKGAFGNVNWASSWTALGDGGYITQEGAGIPDAPVTVNVTDASIDGDTVWTADKTYVLNGLVFVEDGETLTIEPGTVIKGKPGEGADASALVVARGGKIFAEGTAEAPIIFTAEADNVDDPEDFGETDRGLWGGVIVLGRSTLNSPIASGSPITDNIEGIDINEPRGIFGGNDEADNSGVIRYVSIRHGGTLIGADNEINGLTLGAVGSGTTIEFVEVFANLDDGIEFFGGTVNTKYLAVAYCGDDSFDYDQGFRGKGQFWFTIQDGDSGDGGEHDGDIDDDTKTPLSRPEVYNATFIGAGADSGTTRRAFNIRDNAGAFYHNSIFTDFGGRAIDVQDDSAARVGAGDLDFTNNIWWAFGAGSTPETIANANALPLFTEGDRNNAIVDPQLRGVSRTFDRGLDPRLAEGSPAIGGDMATPGDDFFTAVDYKGAFGDRNWASSWTALGAGGYITLDGAGAPGQVVRVEVTDASIDGDVTWTADKTYILNGLVFVEEGETLTIEPGTVIKGKPGEGADASALVVARGGKIFAEGTSSRPIIFTAEADDVNDPEDFGETDRGLWGGVIVLGRSTLNSPTASGTPITDNIEGIDINEPRGIFGGNDEADNSGVIRYISIRHGGTLIGADNEINGLTLGAVGSGTTIEFVEVFANLDDGIEFFGGTVNTKYLAVAYCGDDSFDYDQGFRGKGQFWFTIQDSDSGDGGEHDGDIDDDTKTPLSRPEVYNATFIGAGAESGTTRRAFNIRDNAGALYNNSIFTDFGGRAIDVQDDSAARVGAGDLDFRNNLWWSFGAGSTPETIANANALPLFTEGDRNNMIADPQLNGISRTFDRGLDPRPAAGSPAWGSEMSVPADDFFTSVDYKGAFGNSNWASSWTALGTGGYITLDGAAEPGLGLPVDVTDADIRGDVVWTADKTYILNGLVFVEDGETLTIEPGTVIKGKPGEGADASALVVARGGKIFAEGTADAPIIFTAEADNVNDPEDFGETDRGLWGGLIVLGRSTLNSPTASGMPITDNIEGIDINEPRGIFGGNDEADNSGVIRYISIRHGGTLIGADNEINGLTLGAVGSGTTIEFVEVFANLDDGIEFFGGTVNTKYLAVAYCGDDSFDYDQGFRGKGQFWFTIQDSDSGDGGEHDGDIDDDTKTPLSRPVVYNATFIGAGAESGTTRRAFNIRDNAGALYSNSIFTDFGGRGIDVQDDSAARVGAGDLDFRNNIWWAFGAGSTPETIANANALPLFTEGNRNNQIVDPQLRGISRTFDAVLDPRPTEGSPAIGGVLSVANDPFFSVVDHKGAFGSVNWAASWTALGSGGYISLEGAGVPAAEPVGDTVLVSDASIDGDVTWTSDKTYILNGLVFVEDGETLTIEPGTVIKGKPGEGADASALVVARGGKIFAQGTADAPIIFTAEADDVDDPEDFGETDRGLWGGVIVLGRSTLNSPTATGTPITDNIEGIDINEPRGIFGGSNEADSSGIIKYVSIRHGGTLIGADNEINGLTLGAVGSGTLIEFIEVFANLDDGIEFFGGTVNTRYLAVAYCGDDSFDYDQGFRGRGQFWFTIQDSDSGDGGEHDGDIDDDTKTPLSRPEVFNATFIGAGADSGTTRRAFNIRDNAGAFYHNSIFTDFGGRGIDVQDDSAHHVAGGELDFRNNIWWAFGAGETPEAIANANALPLFTEGDRNNEIVDPQLRGISRTFDAVLDPRPAEGSPALGGTVTAVTSPFFQEVDFKGAFGAVNWLASWSALGHGGYISLDGAGEPEAFTPPVVAPPVPGGGTTGGEVTGIALNVDGTITIEFTGTLEAADGVAGPYAPVAGATSPFTVAADAAMKYYIAR